MPHTKMTADTPIFTEHKFDTAGEILAYLNPNAAQWKEDRQSAWIFRGLSDAEWSLQPSSWRPDGIAKLKPFVDHFEGYRSDIRSVFEKCSQRPDLATEYTIRIAAEYEAVHQFIQLADELGFTIPRRSVDCEWSGQDYLEEVLTKKHLVQFTFPLYFTLAQHHGIPTRLIDWTWSSLKAAYFASIVASKKIPENIAVWALDIGRKKGSKFPFPLVKIVCPRSHHSFLHSQDGLFLMPEYGADRNFWERGDWPDILDLLKLNCPTDFVPLRKLILPSSELPALKEQLWNHRVSLAHLMPALDNVRETVLRRAAAV